MSETAMVSILCSVFSVLVTFFVTHIVDMAQVRKHEQNCPARKDLQSIKAALVYLVVKTGGNPKDLDLMG